MLAQTAGMLPDTDAANAQALHGSSDGAVLPVAASVAMAATPPAPPSPLAPVFRAGALAVEPAPMMSGPQRATAFYTGIVTAPLRQFARDCAVHADSVGALADRLYPLANAVHTDWGSGHPAAANIDAQAS